MAVARDGALIDELLATTEARSRTGVIPSSRSLRFGVSRASCYENHEVIWPHPVKSVVFTISKICSAG